MSTFGDHSLAQDILEDLYNAQDRHGVTLLVLIQTALEVLAYLARQL